MNCRTLDYIVSLVETGSIKAASEKCNASAGTVSHQISKLESYLGVRIFESRHQPVTLTLRGQQLLPLMRSVVSSLKDIQTFSRST